MGHRCPAHPRNGVPVQQLELDGYPHLNASGDVTTAFGSALFLVTAMGCAGAAYVIWLRHATSGWTDLPLDGGMTLRGRRVFGANKRLRGILVLPAAAAISFAAISVLWPSLPDGLSAGLWP